MLWRRHFHIFVRRILRTRSKQPALVESRRTHSSKAGYSPSRWLLALSAGFTFSKSGVSDEDLSDEKYASALAETPSEEEWEVVLDKEKLKVRRRKWKGIYEYYCAGTYDDISPNHFIQAQMDVAYRRQWDANVIDLSVLESDDKTDSQVVRWVAKFPYPMNPRVYIYVRRRLDNMEKKTVLILSKALSSSEYKDTSNYVRVTTYKSHLLVRAHTDFNQKGMDYVLVYYDDPQAAVPSVAYSWVLHYGGPTFLQKVHDAARALQDRSS
jgi:hypothetical protein